LCTLPDVASAVGFQQFRKDMYVRVRKCRRANIYLYLDLSESLCVCVV